MATMRAVVKDGAAVSLRRVPVPEMRDAADVRVRVSVTGLCRTDLLVARGLLNATDPVILGHEFAGTVDAVGPEVREVKIGERVAVNPVLACGRCMVCESGDTINCPHRTMLGIDRDGAFAEFVVLPIANVVPVPPHVSDLAAAYAEPIAAALAVFNANIEPHQRGAIFGANRFARLVERLLRAGGFRDLTTRDAPGVDPRLPPDAFDFVIETGLDGATLDEMIRVARPRGTLVLKSRQAKRVAFGFLAAVTKQLTIRAVNYGPFRKAVGLLAEGFDLADLLGPVRPLDEWEAAFRDANQSESNKLFLAP